MNAVFKYIYSTFGKYSDFSRLMGKAHKWTKEACRISIAFDIAPAIKERLKGLNVFRSFFIIGREITLQQIKHIVAVALRWLSVPIADDIVRIAVCSLNISEIDELVMVLKEVM